MGCFVAAYELLHEMSLIEDAITCLFAAGRQSHAIEIADQYMQDSQAAASNSASQVLTESTTDDAIEAEEEESKEEAKQGKSNQN